MSHLRDAEEDAESDITPMIDAVFLLIVFFLCIDFRSLEAKLPAYMPKDRGTVIHAAEPIEQLSLKIVMDEWGEERPRRAGQARPFALRGHEVHWQLGPRRFDDPDLLLAELRQVAENPDKRVPDRARPGIWKLMSVVIEPQVGATYGDVAQTVDLVSAAGFSEINFGGGRGLRESR